MPTDLVLVAGARWFVRDGLPLSRRVVVIEAVVSGKHNIDKGPTAAPPDDEVVFRFADGRQSRCGLTAFRRTYVSEREVLADAW